MGSPSLTGDRSRWHPVFSSHRGDPHHPRRTMPPPKVPGNAWGCGARVGKGKALVYPVPSAGPSLPCVPWACTSAAVRMQVRSSQRRARGLDCPGTGGPKRCSSAGLLVAGCEASHGRRSAEHGPSLRGTLQGHIPACPAKPCPGEDAPVKAVLPRAGTGTVVVVVVVVVHQLCAGCS